MTATNKPGAARKPPAASKAKAARLPERLGQPPVPEALQRAAAAAAGNGHAAGPLPDAGGALHLTTTAPAGPPVRKVLFTLDSIGGDGAVKTTEHTMLANPTPNLALRYLDVVATKGAGAGHSFAMRKMLGDDGYEALLGYEPLTREQYSFVATTVVDTLLGALDDPKEESTS